MRIVSNILIFGCRPAGVRAIKSCLIREKYDVAAVSDNKKALKIVASGMADLVIIDIAAPGASGLKLARTIKGAENTDFIPVIMIIDAGRDKDRAKGIEAGCSDFISRPFDKGNMTIRIDMALELSRHRSLLDAREKFDHVVNNMENGLIVLDRHLKATHFNNKARELLEIRRKARLGVDFSEHIRGKFEIVYGGDLKRDMKSKSTSFDLVRAERDDAKPLILEAQSNVIKNPLRGMGDILVILTNVTERREEEFLKENFLSLISHKLQTPITVIQSAVSLFQDGLLPPLTGKQTDAIAVISERLDRLRSLVSKLLNFTTIGRNVSYVRREKIGIKEYLPGLVAPMAGVKSDKKIAIEIDCPDEDLSLKINRAHLGLIISNLVDNAVKFNDKDNIIVNIKAEKAAGGVDISVSDNGRGIPPEEREKIFEKFYQAEKDFTGNVEGVGLSLAMVKLLVLAYGGQIQLRSELGKGSSFIMTFPG